MVAFPVLFVVAGSRFGLSAFLPLLSDTANFGPALSSPSQAAAAAAASPNWIPTTTSSKTDEEEEEEEEEIRVVVALARIVMQQYASVAPVALIGRFVAARCSLCFAIQSASAN